jgi:hypothetical protein
MSNIFSDDPNSIARNFWALDQLNPSQPQPRQPRQSYTPDWSDPFTFWSRIVIAAVVGIPLIILGGLLMSWLGV